MRIYRPSLISPTSAGFGSQDDILVRLAAFMIQHGLAVSARNQLSLLPADLVADHIVAMLGLPASAGTVFNMTADDYYNITDITRLLSERYGYRFTYLTPVLRRAGEPPVHAARSALSADRFHQPLGRQDHGDAGQAI